MDVTLLVPQHGISTAPAPVPATPQSAPAAQQPTPEPAFARQFLTAVARSAWLANSGLGSAHLNGAGPGGVGPGGVGVGPGGVGPGGVGPGGVGPGGGGLGVGPGGVGVGPGGVGVGPGGVGPGVADTTVTLVTDTAPATPGAGSAGSRPKALMRKGLVTTLCVTHTELSMHST